VWSMTDAVNKVKSMTCGELMMVVILNEYAMRITEGKGVRKLYISSVSIHQKERVGDGGRLSKSPPIDSWAKVAYNRPPTS